MGGIYGTALPIFAEQASTYSYLLSVGYSLYMVS